LQNLRIFPKWALWMRHQGRERVWLDVTTRHKKKSMKMLTGPGGGKTSSKIMLRNIRMAPFLSPTKVVHDYLCLTSNGRGWGGKMCSWGRLFGPRRPSAVFTRSWRHHHSLHLDWQQQVCHHQNWNETIQVNNGFKDLGCKKNYLFLVKVLKSIKCLDIQ
jgi:hypothetical protein